MTVKVLVKDLALGMFVAELDRPWLDTPFLLQGFLLDNAEDLSQIQRLCQHVFIEPDRSTPDAVAKLSLPPPKAEPAASRGRGTSSSGVAQSIVITSGGSEKKSSLFSDLKEIAREVTSKAPPVEPTPSRAEQPHVIVYRDQPPPKRSHWERAEAPARGQVADSSALAEDMSDLKLHFTQSKDTPKRPGLFRQLLSTFRSKEDEEPEEQAEGANDSGIYFSKPLIEIAENKVVLAAELSEAKEIHLRSREMIRDVVEDLRRERHIDLDKVTEVIDAMVDSVGKNPDALLWLTKLKSRDSYSYDHGIDVAVYLLAFGRHLGYPKENMRTLGMSGLMQDIGKLRIKQELLEKAGKLTSEEFEQVKYHVEHSIDILRQTADVPRDVLQVVAQHHERIDGSGYPQKLKGEQIGAFASMSGIVDSFEALVSERPYAKAISTHQALQQLNRWKGSSFHEALTEQFIQCIGIFPVGSLVELNTGDVAVVIGQNKIRRLKPKVMLLLDPDKQAYKFPSTLDLINDPLSVGNTPYQIKRDLPTGAYGIDPREFYL